MVNGAHDMGGMQCMGPVEPEIDEPVFHHDWERRAFALTLAMMFRGLWNIDMARFAREDTPGADYLRRGYYETWLDALQRQVIEHDLVGDDEIAAARAAAPAGVHAKRIAEPAVTFDTAAPLLAKGGSARIDKDIAPEFKVGDRVRVRNLHPRGHTRAPRYVRGHAGVIDRDHGVFIFPDSHARDWSKTPQHVYAVSFDSVEIWGPEAREGDSICVDLWDAYLEPVS
jgi:nitrile hydratase subunit beta